jgi:hypothetical protein
MEDIILRTNRGTVEALKKRDNDLNESILRRTEWLNNGEIVPERVQPVRSLIWQDKLELFKIHYTIGEDLNILTKEFNELFDTITDWGGAVIGEMLEVTSLCILFNLAKEKMEKLEFLISELLVDAPRTTGIKPPVYYWLVDFLLNKVQGKKCKEYTTDTIKAVPFYTDICAALSNSKNIETAIQTFVTVWTKTPNSKHYIGWGEKKEKDPFAWCFEGAALAALFNMDPKLFEKEVCFPPDLVEYYKSKQGDNYGK